LGKKKKFYAVVNGRFPGIYAEWSGPNGAQVQTCRFKGAIFEGFETIEEAEQFMQMNSSSQPELTTVEGVESNDCKANKADVDVIIYTDGCCIGNPGPGGYGVVLSNGKRMKELSGGYRLTTNNRMELMACIVGLRALKKKIPVRLYSDSKYVVDGITKGWAKKWRANGWIKPSDKKPAINPDLWNMLLDLCAEHKVEFKWVKGHSGVESNERCDYLANQEALKKNLPADNVYEKMTCQSKG
jgi:ribonuclease HI